MNTLPRMRTLSAWMLAPTALALTFGCTDSNRALQKSEALADGGGGAHGGADATPDQGRPGAKDSGPGTGGTSNSDGGTASGGHTGTGGTTPGSDAQGLGGKPAGDFGTGTGGTTLSDGGATGGNPVPGADGSVGNGGAIAGGGASGEGGAIGGDGAVGNGGSAVPGGDAVVNPPAGDAIVNPGSDAGVNPAGDAVVNPAGDAVVNPPGGDAAVNPAVDAGVAPEPDAFVLPPPPPACDAPPCSWPAQNGWGPGARVTYLNVPDTPAEARGWGCNLQGFSNGTALANARGLPIVDRGDLSVYFTPDAAGIVPVVLLARLAGADAGEAFGATGPIDFQFFYGVQQPQRRHFLIDPSSFIPGTQNPSVHFPNTVLGINGRVDAPETDFSLRMPIFPGTSMGVTLVDAVVQGFVSVGAGNIGFNLGNANIQGYLSRDAVINDWILPLQAICNGGAPLQVCAAVGAMIGAPGSCTPQSCLPADLVAAAIGGWEIHTDAAGERACTARVPGDCNAVGVCFGVQLQGVTIDGVAP